MYDFDSVSIGGFLQVQFLVIFQLVTSNLSHLTYLPYHGVVSLLPPPPHIPSPLYFEKNIEDVMITSLYPFICLSMMLSVPTLLHRFWPNFLYAFPIC